MIFRPIPGHIRIYAWNTKNQSCYHVRTHEKITSGHIRPSPHRLKHRFRTETCTTRLARLVPEILPPTGCDPEHGDPDRERP